MKLSEHEEQKIVVEWLDTYAALRWSGLAVVDGRLPYFAVPNGGKRHIATAKKLKAEGVRAGVPDLVIAIPRGQWHGLFVEMKVKKGGVVQPSQRAWINGLIEMGYCAVWCKGADQAIEAITKYLEGPSNLGRKG
jgi:hypothetical protein